MKATDPVCGIKPEAATAKFGAQADGTEYYFCSKDYCDKFMKKK